MGRKKKGEQKGRTKREKKKGEKKMAGTCCH